MKRILAAICSIGISVGIAFSHTKEQQLVAHINHRDGEFEKAMYKGVNLSEIDSYPHDHNGRVQCAAPRVTHSKKSVIDWANIFNENHMRIDWTHKIEKHTHLPLDAEPPSREEIETEFDILTTIANWYGYTQDESGIAELRKDYPTVESCLGLMCPWNQYLDILRVIFKDNDYIPRAYKLPGDTCPSTAEGEVAGAPYNPHPKRKTATTWGALKRR